MESHSSVAKGLNLKVKMFRRLRPTLEEITEVCATPTLLHSIPSTPILLGLSQRLYSHVLIISMFSSILNSNELVKSVSFR